MAARKQTTTKKATKKTAKPAKKRTAKAPAAKAAEATKPSKKSVTIDRRGKADRRQKSVPVSIERRAKVNRRRQIDPTTCERDYNAEEIEFMNAMDHYKRTSGRMFPTCSEVLEVIRSLGYKKVAEQEQAAEANKPGNVEEHNQPHDQHAMPTPMPCLDMPNTAIPVTAMV